MTTQKVPFRSSLITASLSSIFLLLIAIFFMAIFFSIQKQRNDVRNDLLTDTRYVTHITSQALGLPLWNLDAKQVQQQLEALRDNVNFCGARVKDVQGNVFASYQFPTALTSDQEIQGGAIRFKNPVVEGEPGVIGLLEVCVSYAQLDAMQRILVLQQLGFFTLISVAVLLSCYFSLQIMARPLKNIGAAMSRLAQTMEPISDPRLLQANEIGALSTSFNMMAADLSRSYRELSAAKEHAERADRAKSDFLSNMTHELRTPLNSIIGMTSLLLEQRLDAQQREMLDVVSQASHLLLETVNDILDISRIEAGEIKIDQTEFDVGAVIRRIVNTTEPLAQRKGLSLDCEIQHNFPYLVGDPLRLGQIVTNLVSNAVKYTDEGRIQVRVTFREMGEGRVELQCQVKDSGIGIPKERLDDIFAKFTQLDIANSRRYGGSGLGLAITRQLIELMSGKIGVESTPGKGSNFWFNIPFRTTPNLQEDMRLIHRKERQARGTLLPAEANVLVAEDHPLNQAFILLLLKKYGFTNVDLRVNGREVLVAVKQKHYDLVLMDCYMPEITGYEATQAIRNEESLTAQHLPIVAMTANAMVGDYEQCLAMGMDDYISKPVLEKDFLSVLSQWIYFEVPDMGAHFSELAVKEEKEAPAPVNLSIMSTFSKGNRELEAELLSLFLGQSELSLTRLHTACRDGYCKEWIEAAHSLKGGAGGVGAEALRALCERAQMMEDVNVRERVEILSRIRERYAEVKTYLRAQGYWQPSS